MYSNDETKQYRFELSCCNCGSTVTIFAKENEISIHKCERCGHREYVVRVVNSNVSIAKKNYLKKRRKITKFIVSFLFSGSRHGNENGQMNVVRDTKRK